MRDLAVHADFNQVSCCVRDPEFRVGFNSGFGIPCRVPCAVPGTSNECGSSTWDALSRREHGLREGLVHTGLKVRPGGYRPYASIEIISTTWTR